MTIKKYQGKTKEEAIALAKNELGKDAEIMNVEEKKSGGFLGLGKKVVYEITAMVDRDIDEPVNMAASVDNKDSDKSSVSNSSTYGRFSAVADQDIKVSYDKKEDKQELEETKRQFAELSKIFRDNENQTQSANDLSGNNISSNSGVVSDNSNTTQAGNDAFNDITYSNNIPRTSNASNNRGKESVVVSFVSNDDNNHPEVTVEKNNNHRFVKTLYNTLLDNDVDEKYINQLLFDMEKVLKNGKNVNYLISNVYQKMILKLGQPSTISMAKKGPKVVFFIGSTGVGKTTTIAKLASEYKMEQKKEVAFVTIDTYRLKATDQLGEYASIMKIPMSVIYEPGELSEKVDRLSGYDLILVDTSGFSHKNNEMRENVVKLINELDEKYEKEVYLVLSSTTKYKDLKEIIDSYKEFTEFKMIFTKLDETTNLGNILNCRLYSGSSLSYVTNGQNVPNDIEVLDTQKLVKQLLGGD
ncbi:MAG: flagellar biosynthesis protein FlhF [Lachnospiraceae bacterium]|nr:flagellar biosynthesis protein FlhF [Lachnospiraceae bacterium]